MKRLAFLLLIIFLISCDRPKVIFDKNYYNGISGTLINDSASILKYIYHNDTVNGWTDYKRFYSDCDSIRLKFIYEYFKSNIFKRDSVYSLLDTIVINNDIGFILLEKHKPFYSYSENSSLYLLIMNLNMLLKRTIMIAKDFNNNLGECGNSKHIKSILTTKNKLIICLVLK